MVEVDLVAAEGPMAGRWEAGEAGEATAAAAAMDPLHHTEAAEGMFFSHFLQINRS